MIDDGQRPGGQLPTVLYCTFLLQQYVLRRCQKEAPSQRGLLQAPRLSKRWRGILLEKNPFSPASYCNESEKIGARDSIVGG